jgi:hypothetical protein
MSVSYKSRYSTTALLSTAACLLAVCASCTSIESTMVTRDETNQFWERHNCLNGIPITLKVPTHLKVYVFHKHYLEATEDPVKKKTVVSPVGLDIVVRDFAHEFMYTEKIFVVDFKRPAAGSSNLRINMTEEQYIDEIQHDITDETITAVTALLGSFTGADGFKPKAASAIAPSLKELRSLVAVGIFEIDAPDFELKLEYFIDCHVNKSHDAWVVPPQVADINRVGIHPADNTVVPYPPVPLCPCPGECPQMPIYEEAMPFSMQDSYPGYESVVE